MAEATDATPHPLTRYPHAVVTQAYRIENVVYSDHNHPVVRFNEPAADRWPIITCEFYSKWYSLYIWWPDGNLLKLEYHEIDEDIGAEHSICAFVDHVPNPKAVELYAEKHGYVIDELAHDLITGRWHNEVK